MIKSIFIFFKYQIRYLLILTAVFVLPLGLFYHYSTYELPMIQYVFLIALFVSQFYYYSEKEFHRKIKNKVTRSLNKELKKNPSQKEVSIRSIQIEFHRNISIALITLSIFTLMIYYQKF